MTWLIILITLLIGNVLLVLWEENDNRWLSLLAVILLSMAIMKEIILTFNLYQ